MERIKIALEKARAEKAASSHDSHGGSVTAGNEPNANSRSPATELAVTYSKTQVVEINKKHWSENNIVLDESDPSVLAAYKMLRTQIMQRMVAQDWNTLAVTSPSTGDGKTITAINLAVSLARELHHTVLLVDLDLCNPNIYEYFGIKPEKGLDDYLEGKIGLGDALINPGVDRLVLLPTKTKMGNSSELLASPSMGALVDELKSRYPSRMVIFDLPPVLCSDDALSFSPHVDAFLVVARESKTTEQELARSLEILSGVPIIGTLLNASEERAPAYY